MTVGVRPAALMASAVTGPMAASFAFDRSILPPSIKARKLVTVEQDVNVIQSARPLRSASTASTGRLLGRSTREEHEEGSAEDDHRGAWRSHHRYPPGGLPDFRSASRSRYDYNWNARGLEPCGKTFVIRHRHTDRYQAMTYNFDPELWYENQKAALEKRFQSGEMDRKAYEKALQLNPKFRPALVNKCELLSKLNKTHEDNRCG